MLNKNQVHFALGFVVIGVVVMFGARAASPYFSFEAEDSNLTSPAAQINDTTASGESHIKFGTDGSSSEDFIAATLTSDNTGPRVAYSELTPISGGMTITEDNAVIEKVDVQGDVVIKANNVTIRDCRIYGYGYYAVRTYSEYSGTRVEFCELDGRSDPSNPDEVGRVDTHGIAGGSDTYVYRTEMHHTGDASKTVNGATYIENYCHDLAGNTVKHSDCIQSTGNSNVTIKRNRLEAVLNPAAEANGGLINASLQIKGDSASIENFIIEDNLLKGGAYTVQIRKGNYNLPANINVSGNRYTKDAYKFGNCVYTNGSDIVFTGNIFDDGTPAGCSGVDT